MLKHFLSVITILISFFKITKHLYSTEKNTDSDFHANLTVFDSLQKTKILLVAIVSILGK